MKKIIAFFLCLNLLVNSFLPVVVYAQVFDPGGGEGGDSEEEVITPPVCTDVYRYNECNWDTNQVYEVYQNTCTDEYDRRNYQYQEGQCGYSAQPQPTVEPAITQASPIPQESEDYCQLNPDDQTCPGRAPSPAANNCLYDSARNCYDSDTPSCIAASNEAQIPLCSALIAPEPTPEITQELTPTPEFSVSEQQTPIITDETAQGAAMQVYYDSAQAEQARAELAEAQARAEANGGAGNISQTPDYLALAAAGAWDNLADEAKKIANFSATPAPIYDFEAELAKAEKQAQEQAEIEQQRKDALVAAMNLSSEQRIAALNASMGLSQDTSPAQTLSYFNGAAKSLGVKIDVWEDGSYTISLDQPAEATGLTYTPYVPGSSFAPASISASSTIDPKPFCDHIKDSVEKDKCQNEWRTIAVGGTVAVTAAGAAIVSAPVWLPATSAGLSTAATVINTGTTAIYVYPTVAGGVLLSRSPAIAQRGIGFLAQKSSVVIPAAVWLSCQFQNNPVDCVSRDLGMADLPMVLAEGVKAARGVKAAAKVQGGVEVAAQRALDLAMGGERAAVTASNVTEVLEHRVQYALDQALGNQAPAVKARIAANGNVYFDQTESGISLLVTPQEKNGLPPVLKVIDIVDYKSGKGLGTGIVEAWEKTMAEMGYETIGITDVMPASEEFWRKKGYKPVVEGKDFQAGGNKIWVKSLTPNSETIVQDAKQRMVNVVASGEDPGSEYAEAFAKALADAKEQNAVKVVLEDTTGVPIYVPFPNQPKNVTVSSITDDMRFEPHDVAGISTASEALAKAYPDQTFNVVSTKGSSAIILDNVDDPSKVLKVGRQGTDSYFEYFDKEAEDIRRLSEKGLAPRLYKYIGKGVSNVPILVMDRVDFTEGGIRTLTKAEMEAEIERVTSGLKEIGLGPGDVEFVVDNKTGHLISVDSGGFMPLDEKGLMYGDSPLEKEVRSLIEGDFFGTFFSDLKRHGNPAEGLVQIRAELQQKGFSEETLRMEIYGRYKNMWMVRNLTTGKTAADVFDYPFNKDAGGQLLNLADNVAQGAPETQIRQITNSLSGRFSQDALDKAIEAGRQAGTTVYSTVKGVSTQVAQSFVDSDDYDLTKIMKADEFEFLAKKELIKKKLQKEGKIDSQEVITILQSDQLQPRTTQLSSGAELLITGKAGTVEGIVDNNKYLVEVFNIPNLDIKVPALIDLSSGGDVFLGVAVKEGTGKVETLGYAGGRDDINFSLVKTAYAQESNSAKVKVVVFADNNGNGLLDNEEKALPWAGVSIKLTKVNEENTVNLNAGWNLVSLTSLPEKALTASTLLAEISSQGGEATTVSTLIDGAWKSYVVRGNSDYSMDDFPIEIGKSYFVKALKPSTFTYSGQNLVAPVKVKVQPGWNTVGFPFLSKAYQASGLVKQINADTVSRWESGLWDSFMIKNAQKYGEDFNIESNKGYILKVNQEGELIP